MTDIAFTIAKGREVEFYNRVLNNDPANAVLVLVLLDDGSTIDQLGDQDTLADVLATGYDEIGNTGYARIVLDQADLASWTPDDTNNRVDLGLGVQVFPTVSAGDIIDVGVVCYDSDSTGGTDSGIIPITAHELRIGGARIPGNGDDIEWDLSEWISAV